MSDDVGLYFTKVLMEEGGISDKTAEKVITAFSRSVERAILLGLDVVFPKFGRIKATYYPPGCWKSSHFHANKSHVDNGRVRIWLHLYKGVGTSMFTNSPFRDQFVRVTDGEK